VPKQKGREHPEFFEDSHHCIDEKGATGKTEIVKSEFESAGRMKELPKDLPETAQVKAMVRAVDGTTVNVHLNISPDSDHGTKCPDDARSM
jgi:hypothetical protein